METAEQQDLTSYKHWEKWLSEDVDEIGNTWEYEEDADEKKTIWKGDEE